MEERIEYLNHLRTEPVVGKVYLVPCFEHFWFNTGIGPVLGSFHDDSKFGFGQIPHLHPDLRFLTDVDYDSLVKFQEKNSKKGEISEFIFFKDRGSLTLRPMKCRRLVGPYVRSSNSPAAVLDNHFKAARLNLCRLRCPHKGTHLGSMPKCHTLYGDKAVVCPSHGLAWSLKSGKMIPHKEVYR